MTDKMGPKEAALRAMREQRLSRDDRAEKARRIMKQVVDGDLTAAKVGAKPAAKRAAKRAAKTPRRKP